MTEHSEDVVKAAINIDEIYDEAVKTQRDFYVLAASKAYGVAYDDVTDDQRMQAKNALFFWSYRVDPKKVVEHR